ncbi:MAG: hypothetical protein JSV49_02410 [Thermoplasmata archaeon]|nr:MAG: hypothetical protein JSV49_02410 [Thermoplasmata archaeon]
MAFCSNCGASLAGAKNFCSRCGYKAENIPETTEEEVVLEAEPVESEDVDEEEKESEPVFDRTCVECEEEASQKCYFCWANICTDHTKRLQIFINKAPFGNQVVSCRKCANDKQNKQPTQQEAEGASLFFGVKPYHEWKLVE